MKSKIFFAVMVAILSVSVSTGALAQGRLLAEPADRSTLTQAPDIALFHPSDQLAIETSGEQFDSYAALAGYFASAFDDEELKARSIYTWIAMHISYDVSVKSNIEQTDQSAEIVWSNKKAVCEGFANLFHAMCTAAGLESRTIKGYVNDFTGNEMRYPNHAWNSIKIDGTWKLLDVTWASQNLSDTLPTSGLFSHPNTRLLNEYFLVPPKDMIKTHLPEDPYWQLQHNRINLLTFMKGKDAIENVLSNPVSVHTSADFEALISNYEQKDSLDRAISYLERMEPNPFNHAKEYGLAIAYFYKAQELLRLRNPNHQRIKNQAKDYYQKSLSQLDLLKKDDYGFEFSRALAKNVAFRIDTLR